MKRFDDTRFWEIIETYDSNPAVATVELDGILDEFIAGLHTYCRDEKNIAERTRILNYYRGIELVTGFDALPVDPQLAVETSHDVRLLKVLHIRVGEAGVATEDEEVAHLLKPLRHQFLVPDQCQLLRSQTISVGIFHF